MAHGAQGGSGGFNSDALIGPTTYTNTLEWDGSNIYSVGYNSSNAWLGSVKAVTEAGDSSATASGSPDCNSGGGFGPFSGALF